MLFFKAEKEICKNQIPKSFSINSFSRNNEENSLDSNRYHEICRKRKILTVQSPTINPSTNIGVNSQYFSLNQNFNFTSQTDESLCNLNSTLPVISFASLEAYNTSNSSLKNRTESFHKYKTKPNFIKPPTRCSNLSLNTILPKENLKHKLFIKSLSLNSELPTRKLNSLKDAFRLFIFMLPPANKRRLHFLLRFLNMLKSSQNSYKHLLENRKRNNDLSISPELNSYDDLSFIDSSIISNDLTSSAVNEETDKRKTSDDQKVNVRKVEAFLIKSFYESIVFIEKFNGDELKRDEDERLGMKLVQILINNYHDVIRIPKDLIKNVEKEMEKLNQDSKMNHDEQEVLNQPQKQSCKYNFLGLSYFLQRNMTYM